MPCSPDLPSKPPPVTVSHETTPYAARPKPSGRITGRSALATFCPAAYSAEYGIGDPAAGRPGSTSLSVISPAPGLRADPPSLTAI